VPRLADRSMLETTTIELRRAVEHALRHRGETNDVPQLAQLLYASWYAREFAPVSEPPEFPRELVQACRAADATTSSWSGGWIAEQVGPGGAVVARRGREIRFAARCDHVVVGRNGLLARPGDALELCGRRELLDPDGSWWRTSGESWRFRRAHAGLVRLYWNVELAQIPTLVGELTSMLASESRPWMLKVATQRAAHTRADANVLFLSRDAVASHADAVEALARRLGTDLREGAPPLTLPICRGLAAAFDPGGDESFGLHRCGLVAEALEGIGTDDPEPHERVRAHFESAGIDLERPYALRTDPLLPWEA
jgi:hypothetical protein